jgi:hypothetical protein
VLVPPLLAGYGGEDAGWCCASSAAALRRSLSSPVFWPQGADPFPPPSRLEDGEGPDRVFMNGPSDISTSMCANNHHRYESGKHLLWLDQFAHAHPRTTLPRHQLYQRTRTRSLFSAQVPLQYLVPAAAQATTHRAAAGHTDTTSGAQPVLLQHLFAEPFFSIKAPGRALEKPTSTRNGSSSLCCFAS